MGSGIIKFVPSKKCLSYFWTDPYPCTTIKKQKAKRKKHNKKVVVLHPGKHTQMDVKYQLHLILNGQKSYVYNLIDHASKLTFRILMVQFFTPIFL